MAKEYPRSQRVADQIQRELAQLVQRDMSDPRLGFLSIASVEVSRDLAYATVYVSTLSDVEHDEVIKVLNGAKGFLRREMGRAMRLRVVPELKFIYDDTLEKGIAMSKLIDDAINKDDEKE